MKHLKKSIWLLFASLLPGYNLPAQSHDEGASLGVKFGVNVTNYNIKEANLKTAPGFNLGIFSNAALSKHFSLQPEINLNIQNVNINVNNELSNSQYNLLLSYVELAITGRVSCRKVYLQAGPYISYLANSTISNNNINDAMNRKNFYDIDYGLIYSGGLQLKRWDLGIRFNHGMYEIGKPYTSEKNLNIFRNSKTSSFQLYAGYYF
ncbi:MAG TPA: porin family protein [Bacteroidia bacterium]|nr:porin family protein [Bacteroidia bacterium]